jgi:hypothetical protein
MSIRKLLMVVRVALVCILIALVGAVSPSQKCRAGCGPNDGYCTSQCCLGTTVADLATGCVAHAGWCQIVWDPLVKYTCPSPGCALTNNQHDCQYNSNGTCTLIDSWKSTGCCMAGGPPATDVPHATDVPPTDTPIPTRTPTRTASPTRTPTRTPIPTLAAGLTARYSSLVLMAPKLSLPTQILNGTITGGSLPYSVTFHVARPDGSRLTYNLMPGATFRFGASESGDTNFGVSQQGPWRAWFTVSSSDGQNSTSNTVVWDVAFYPVHQTP